MFIFQSLAGMQWADYSVRLDTLQRTRKTCSPREHDSYERMYRDVKCETTVQRGYQDEKSSRDAGL